MTAAGTAPWWETNYLNLDYVHSYADQGEAKAHRDVEFLLRRLSLPPDARILDVCCAHGRHVMAFARRGFYAIGLDRSPVLLAEAQRRAQQLPAEAPLPSWILADARSVPVHNADLILNALSSFGFFDEEADNRGMLHACAAALRPGGSFVIDLFLRNGTISGLAPQTWREDPERLILREHHYRAITRRLERRTVVYTRATLRRSERHSSMRLYDAEEITDLVRNAGLEIISRFADWCGTPWSEDARRLILIARRPN